MPVGGVFFMKYLPVVIVCMIYALTIVCSAEDAMSWRLNTDDTTMVVAVRQGVPVVTELSSTKRNSNWLLAPAPEALLPSVTQQGVSLATQWRYEGGALDPKSGELVLRFSNASPALELQS